jgi:hypothetical protein
LLGDVVCCWGRHRNGCVKQQLQFSIMTDSITVMKPHNHSTRPHHTTAPYTTITRPQLTTNTTTPQDHTTGPHHTTNHTTTYTTITPLRTPASRPHHTTTHTTTPHDHTTRPHHRTTHTTTTPPHTTTTHDHTSASQPLLALPASTGD